MPPLLLVGSTARAVVDNDATVAFFNNNNNNKNISNNIKDFRELSTLLKHKYVYICVCAYVYECKCVSLLTNFLNFFNRNIISKHLQLKQTNKQTKEHK